MIATVTSSDTLEAHKERLLRYIKESPDPERTVAELAGLVKGNMSGQVTQAVKGKAKPVPWQNSVYAYNKPGERERLKQATAQAAFKDVPGVVKRSGPARVEALTRRLVEEWRKAPQLVEATIREIQTDYWKAGMPVSEQELRDAAVRLLQIAERKRASA